MDVNRIIESMKGISGSGNTLSKSIQDLKDFIRTLEPGDFVRDEPEIAVAAPIAYDVWYLNCHKNFLAKYFEAAAGFDGDHYNYSGYLYQNMGFLENLPALKPLKTLRDLEKHLSSKTHFDIFSMKMRTEWLNDGIYWINLMAFELWQNGLGQQYPSDGPKGFDINDYVGYLTFPIGQLGVMEVISIIQETGLMGYAFAAVDSLSTYWPKAALTEIPAKDTVSIQTTPEIFPDMKDEKGNPLAGQNYCYGRHLIENAYLIPETSIASQNEKNSSGGTAYAPVPKQDVELFSSKMERYGEDAAPKKWMRYWIHKDSTLPVPGEFIGILCRPVACPPHVWWFQESSPFVYAGNWVETCNLTSGVVTAVTLEADRTDGKIGNQYRVKIQGCEVIIEATDFFLYSVGDRVAIIKMDSIASMATKSFTWLDQPTMKETDNMIEKTTYIILPATFYKIKT